jgi:exodeoxyribonuclease V alpha subunit
MNSSTLDLEGVVQLITFQNPENHYCVARVQSADPKEGLVTVVGTLPDLQKGGCYVFHGVWDVHQKFGPQFKAEGLVPKMPVTIEGMKKYLGSGLIKGIGPAMAGRIVDCFGLETFTVIEQQPERLAEVPKLGAKKRELVKQGWERQQGTREIFLFLQEHNVGTHLAHKIFKQYGQNAVTVLKTNPFRLADDIWGIGFRTADVIAQKVGVAADAPARLAAGIVYTLQNAASDGHIYLPVADLTAQAAEILGVPVEALTVPLTTLIAANRVVQAEDKNYLPHLFAAETEIVRHLGRLRGNGQKQEHVADDNILAAAEQKLRVTFSPEQRAAVRTATGEKVLIITGGPGTGKTTTLVAVAAMLKDRGLAVELAAPTGRAAKRMSEATGFAARTIHRLLEYNPGKNGFNRHEQNPLDLDVLVLDECSMIDAPLLRDLTAALPQRARLVLVGDRDQLPSVGPGNVFRDLIESGRFPVINLNRIFRQAEASLIVVNAHRVNQGQLPQFKADKDQNFFFIEEADPLKIQQTIVDLVAERLPKAYGFNPKKDIQVIAPMYKGEIGVSNLNRLLQARLNPAGAEIERGGVIYRVGDRVMQVRNNYDQGVFNGDQGYIISIDPEEQEVAVRFDNEARYDFDGLDELAPAYAITVHKSQGSEYRAVVLPMATQHYVMLQRNLLYTAMTRARELLVVVGTTRALAIAVKNDQIKRRFTSLKEKLAALPG